MTILDYVRGLSDQVPEQVGALILSGAGGAYVRAIFQPEQHWRKRVLEGFAGALSAIFLGGLVGHILQMATGAGTWAYLAAGFVMGEGGIAAVRAVRHKIIAEEDSK